MADILPDRGDDFAYDSLMYLGTVLIAFGIGHRLDLWLTNDAYLAPVLYTGILVAVYWKWAVSHHSR